MNTFVSVCAALLALPVVATAYEKAFKETKAGTIEVKIIPERTLIVAENPAGYFDENNRMFGKLFRYIRDNEVSMTVPVKAEINPGKMYFYVGTEDLDKNLKDNASVRVITEPSYAVMSLGVRGGYSEKTFNQAREKLLNQLALSEKWRKTGPVYAIYWNGPYVPAFMKKFEVHVPVIKIEKSDV